MKHLALGLALALFAAPAMAFHCPLDMGKIDAALAAGTDLTEDELSQIATWRAEGERLHHAGDHAAAVEELGKALEMLGLD